MVKGCMVKMLIIKIIDGCAIHVLNLANQQDILIKCYGSRSSLNLKSYMYHFFNFQTKQIRLSDIGICFGRGFFSVTHVYIQIICNPFQICTKGAYMILKHFMLDKRFLPCIVHLICKFLQGFEIMIYLCKIKWTENQSRKD